MALPTRLVEGPLTWPGQDAGFLGPRHDPWQLRLDPNRPEARDDSLALPAGLDPARLHRRRHLLEPDGRAAGRRCRSSISRMPRIALLCNGKVGQALDIEREDPRLVDRYGRHLVRPVAPDRAAAGRGRRADRAGDDGDRADLGHARRQLPPAARRACCRRWIRRSRPCSTTSSVRGLLDETLVVMLGEFGRTPRISRLTPGAVPGRDHWPAVFPAVFAGAGVVGGQVIGKSDRLGAYPVSRSFGPPDLAATIYHALGVDPATELRDRLGRPLRLCSGEVIDAALHDGAGVNTRRASRRLQIDRSASLRPRASVTRALVSSRWAGCREASHFTAAASTVCMSWRVLP